MGIDLLSINLSLDAKIQMRLIICDTANTKNTKRIVMTVKVALLFQHLQQGIHMYLTHSYRPI